MFTKLAVPVEWLPSLCQHPNNLLRMVSNTRMFPTFMAPPTVAPCSLYNTKWNTYEWSFSYYKRFVIKVLHNCTIVLYCAFSFFKSYSRLFCIILTTALMHEIAYQMQSNPLWPIYIILPKHNLCYSTQSLQRCVNPPWQQWSASNSWLLWHSSAFAFGHWQRHSAHKHGWSFVQLQDIQKLD